MSSLFLVRLLLPLAALLLLLPAAGRAEDTSLYQRLGGEPAVRAVMGKTLATVAANPELNHTFKNVNLSRLADRITLFVCAHTGGGCVYQDDSIREIHAGLGITGHEFDAFVAILKSNLDAAGVGTREKGELLRLLAPMKQDIVAP
ncbi:MAG: group 1 truncated hemoglobin [Proteobacteria bacterium]|nr:group 1 truncated hemoglobin [Pseudomonadota bacterium]HQR03227.1 group 1 truncated hemoglobin [Rhodocyclaceae bacterium]